MNQSKQSQENEYSAQTTSQNQTIAHSSLRSSTLKRSRKDLSLSRECGVGTFGRSSRGDLFGNTVCSPAAKYNIKTGFEISLMEKKGTSISSSRSSLGKSNFSYIQKTSNPGPGSYNPQKPKTKKKIVIGLKNRQQCKQTFLNEKAVDKNPAPNKYTVKEPTLAGGKMSTLSIRFNNGKENKPGPGTYYKTEISLRPQTPQSTFGKSSRKGFFEKSTERCVSPGPAQYRLHSQFE